MVRQNLKPHRALRGGKKNANLPTFNEYFANSFHKTVLET